MENRLLIQVTNDSEHTFELDGDWLRSGEWKSEKKQQIDANTLTLLEFHSSGIKGVAGVAWWTDSKNHDVYLSMAFSNPRLQSPTFTCYAGLPPHDLKAELDVSPRLVKDEQVLQEQGGCAWVAPALGTLTVVRVMIMSDLPRYTAPKASLHPRPSQESAAPPQEELSTPQTGQPTSEVAAPVAPAVLSTCTELAPSASSNSPAAGAGDVHDEESAKEAMSKFFAQTRPKDALDGLGRGFQTAGTSILAGVGSMVASTVHGAQREGALGAVKGFGAGLVGGLAIAVGGAACGVAQVGRGIANTPEAFRGRRDQRVWDPELGQWVDLDLPALEEQVAEEGSDEESSSSSSPAGPSTAVLETELYDLLKVSPASSASEIKKAYYKEARQCHPDKNPGDVAANAKFQKLADAYQVLSDPKSRNKYDREGKGGVEAGNVKMDPAVFFSLLFGSEKFEPWIGELHIAMQTNQFAKSLEKEEGAELTAEESMAEGEASAQSMKRRQLRREVRCASYLRSRLDRFVEGRDPEGFAEQMRLEAVELSSGHFGMELIIALGEIYQRRAEIYLADELIGRFSLTKRIASIRHSTLTMAHTLHFYQNAAGSLLRVKKMHDVARKSQPQNDAGEPTEEQKSAFEAAINDALPVFLQTAWAAVVTDIDSTIKEVGRKLLKDKSVPWQIRVRRAQALLLLGQIFVEEGQRAAARNGASSKSMSSEAAKAVLQEALMGSVRESKR